MNAVINKGLAILLPKVAIMRREIQEYLTKLLERADYLPLFSPHIGSLELFETSGHYPYYKKDMFSPIGEISDSELPVGDLDYYLLKPMNCPFHIQAYQSEPRSYRDLPLRYYEFGTVYRHEYSGAINGLFRLRGFTQDDGHIFCTVDQIEQEINKCVTLIQEVMKLFGMEVTYTLSLRDDTNLSKYVGSDDLWVKATGILWKIMEANKELWTIDVGGAAFYGPKIDFHVTDKLDREWQLGTVQLDFTLPERFELEYKDSDNTNKRPVMIHRALLGSIERFIAILLEQEYLPLWLYLEQVRIIPVHKDQLAYARHCKNKMKDDFIRATVDEEEAPLSAKVKKAIDDKVPIRVVVGKKEEADKSVTVEYAGKKEVVSLDDFCGFRLLGYGL